VGNNYYKVGIDVSSSTNPVIWATGYATVPISGKTLARALRVRTTRAPLFSTAMFCKTNITLSGGGITTDSYDSSIGEYGVVAGNVHAKGDLVTDSNSTDPNRPAIDLNNST